MHAHRRASSSPQNHPDKGGDATAFAAIQRAYDVLSDAEKRARYDATGTYEKTVEEELLEDFGGGAFRDRGVESEVRTASLADAIVKTEENKSSHTAGFEAWMRARVRRRRRQRTKSPNRPKPKKKCVSDEGTRFDTRAILTRD